MITKYRKSSLLAAGLFGVGLAFVLFPLLIDTVSFIGDQFVSSSQGYKTTLRAHVTLLLLGLPIFFVLWLFRTYDVQRQIDKSQESIHNSSFFECARMLTDENDLAKKIALEQLAYLKEKSAFDEERIDFLTQGISLIGKDSTKVVFRHARLKGLNLSKASMCGISLTMADLREVNLSGADLSRADLSGADLRGARLEGTIWQDGLGAAFYDTDTKFPNDFYPDTAGLVLRNKQELEVFSI